MPDSPEIGPGGLQLVDLGGCGDCAYRCIAYGLTYLSANGFVNDPAAEDEAKTKVKELGLRMQAMTNNTSWQEFWAPDESATECSEAGAVPGNLEMRCKESRDGLVDSHCRPFRTSMKST